MENPGKVTILFAPLQEATQAVYRNAHHRHFGGVDRYFAPYIVRQNDGTVKGSHMRDIHPDNNEGVPLVPQILAGNADDFLCLFRILEDFGYREINWNLGCPYPMVTNKGLGSGLLPYPEKIRSILTECIPKLKSTVTVKMRSGLLHPEEVFRVIEMLNEFPLGEIILHPRIGKQLYKGVPDPEVFAKAGLLSVHPMVYNGDIVTLADFNRLRDQFRNARTWMIGRGILQNPFLPGELKEEVSLSTDQKVTILRRFHAEILQQNGKILSGPSHLLFRMEKFWSYFCYSFPDPHKTLKRIRKASDPARYEAAVQENFRHYADAGAPD